VSVVVSSTDFDPEVERVGRPPAGAWEGVLKTDPTVLTFPDE
jgi:hypothetical protein